MSGGSYDYAYSKVQDMAERLAESKDPLRRAFADHLKLVADAMQNIEWVDSGDYISGDEIDPIKKVLGGRTEDIVLKYRIIEADEALCKLAAALQKAKEAK
jgi:hypothetical protein